MPPSSYVITAIILAVLVAASVPMTLGYSIIIWYWVFAAAACILTIMGVFRAVSGLHFPLWIGVALALPSFVWAADHFYKLPMAASLAPFAAALAAVRLMETMSAPHAAFRIGYWLLAASALLQVGGVRVAYAAGWTFANSALLAFYSALWIAAALFQYGAFVGAAVVITKRRSIEIWICSAISLVAVYMLYWVMRPVSLMSPIEGAMFWLQPVMMFIGGAAVWRMGSILRAQALSGQFAQT